VSEAPTTAELAVLRRLIDIAKAEGADSRRVAAFCWLGGMPADVAVST
jgi:hypothetical protein